MGIQQIDEAGQIPLFRFLTYRILRVHTKLNAQATRFLKESSGLSLSQWRVVAMVGVEKETTLSGIVRLSQMDKGQVSRCVKTLIGDGIITTSSHETDQRRQLLSLTDKGRALYRQTLPNMRRRQAHLMQQLDPEELRVLYAALDKLELAAEWEGDDA